MPSPPDFVLRRLATIAEAGLTRKPPTVETEDGVHGRVDGRAALLFCSNDYLGLRTDPRIRRAAAQAAERWGGGSGSSRLIAGSLPPHRELEEAVAEWLGAEAALVCSSGYQANLALLQGLAGRGDGVASDALNHASIIDGCRLSRATVGVFGHGDVDGAAAVLDELPGGGARFVVTEGLYSMDGDRGPLRELASVAAGAGGHLLVDEAHALGVLGPAGRGATAEADCDQRVLARVGTFGKALGGHGAFIATDASTRELLVNAGRTYIFTTGLAPAAVGAAREGVRVAASEEGQALRRTLAESARWLRSELSGAGWRVAGDDDTPIIPLVVGAADIAMRLYRRLLEAGIYAMAIRPPTVPDGTCRIRFTLSASHRREHLETLLAALGPAPGIT